MKETSHVYVSLGGDDERDSGATKNIATASEGHLSPKVFIVYPQNPEVYEQISPPNIEKIRKENPRLREADIIAKHREEIVMNRRFRENNISKQRNLVQMFAEFLQCVGITVSYGQQLDDMPVKSKLQWMQDEIKNSDYVIFIITPSFNEFMNNPPQEEIFFQGSYLRNLVDNLEKRADGSSVNMVCVFLDTPICLDHVPTALRSGHNISVALPFFLNSQREDGLNQLVSLIKHGQR